MPSAPVTIAAALRERLVGSNPLDFVATLGEDPRFADGVLYEIYVHAKNVIVDDVWASVGSSNIGYRGQTYDTEINCDVVDGEIVRGARRYARDLRLALWREHLRLATG